MELGPHAAFIVGSYAAAALIVLALVGWVILDHRAQTRNLRDLEARGVSRRSARQAGKPS
ncbi:MAG: heme exporter protein CcmD [Xanthobacteraceae bacterium]